MSRNAALLASMVLLVLSADHASAWYHAPLGRWVNRDPIGYGGNEQQSGSRWSADDGGYDIDSAVLYSGRSVESADPMQLNRGYPQQLGAWARSNSVEHFGSMNLYQYVLGSPTSCMDPSGLIHVPSGPPSTCHTEQFLLPRAEGKRLTCAQMLPCPIGECVDSPDGVPKCIKCAGDCKKPCHSCVPEIVPTAFGLFLPGCSCKPDELLPLPD